MLRFLGSCCSGELHYRTRAVSVGKTVLLGASQAMQALKEPHAVTAVFLNAPTFSQVGELPALIAEGMQKRTATLTLYGSKHTLEGLQRYVFNDHVAPDYTRRSLPDGSAVLRYEVCRDGEEVAFEEASVIPYFRSATAYIVKSPEGSVYLAGDDRIDAGLIERHRPSTLMCDVCPQSGEAWEAPVFTPSSLAKAWTKSGSEGIVDNLYFYSHSDHRYSEEEFKPLNAIPAFRGIVHEHDSLTYDGIRIASYPASTTEILDIASALSSEKKLDELLRRIVSEARHLTGADGGTLYLLTDDEHHLRFNVVQSSSLHIETVYGHGPNEQWPKIALYEEDGMPNHKMVASHCAITNRLVNIADAYAAGDFDFEGTKRFDAQHGYRSKSMLVVPLRDHEQRVVGVLQMINKTVEGNGLVPFTDDDERHILSLGSMAAVAINNKRLIDDLEKLLRSFLNSIIMAIDEKSAYTAGHIHRMVDLTQMLAQAVDADTLRYRDISIAGDALEQIRLAALMHDIGKITTPEHIVDKPTKLSTVFDRIMLIRVKGELLKLQEENRLLRENGGVGDEAQARLDTLKERVDNEIRMLVQLNEGAEYVPQEELDEIREIAKRTVRVNGDTVPMLDEDELANMMVQKGTLTDEQRDIINNHALVSLNMLRSMTFPKKYMRVPEIAGGHHEKINGEGYPLGLKADEISLETRILAIADVFEALTAVDRPYKKPKKLSEAMKILAFMAKDEELDKTLVRLFYESGVYLEYAKKYMAPEYIDKVELSL